MTGTNHDEYRLFVPNGLMTAADYEAAFDALWGGFGAGFPPLIFGVLYPLINYPTVPPYTNPSPGIALGASGTDGVFVCPEHNTALLLSQFVPTHAYEFNDENAPFLFQPFFQLSVGRLSYSRASIPVRWRLFRIWNSSALARTRAALRSYDQLLDHVRGKRRP
jgi:hypothetical protein